MIVSYPTNSQETNAIKAVLRALNVKFEIQNEKTLESSNPSKKEVVSNLKVGVKELKLYKKGKLKTTPAKDFLNEL
jgi:hypothetical protein